MIAEKKLAEIMSAGNVKKEPEVLEAYSGDLSPVNKVKPAYVVKAKTSEQIQALVKLAQASQTPLVPISSGPPHFHGDTVPGIGGAIIVDLSEMKKILWVNRENRVVVFEPGVTFAELIPAVAKEGLRLNMPLHPRRTKSVLGSMLSREPVILPKYHWDIADPLASTEVIFGTGDMFRTGAAAGPGTIEEQRAAGGAQKEAAGPNAMSWHRLIQGSQGTMGIVTWASARCELLPQMEEPFFIGSDDLGKLLEAVHWLVRLRLVNECFILNGRDFAALLAPSADAYSQLQGEAADWILFFNIAAYDYLPQERLNGQILDMQDLMQKIGLTTVKSMGGISAFSFLNTVRSPSAEPYWKLRPRGGCEDTFFLTTYDKIDGLVKTMLEALGEAGLSPANLGIYLQPVVQGVNCHCEFNLFYNPQDRHETERVQALVVEIIKPLMAKGAFFSRPYGTAAGMIMNTDAATVDTLKKVKAIVDPDNILNPGKLCF